MGSSPDRESVRPRRPRREPPTPEFEREQFLATHDALTLLPNRFLFGRHLEQALAHAGRHGESLAVLLVDLDRFAWVNETLGDQAGDAVLRAAAKRIAMGIRRSDVAARLHADEFAVLVHDVRKPEDARQVADALARRIQGPTAWKGHELSVGASIGVAVYPDHAEDVEGLLGVADTALLRAKAIRGVVVLAPPPIAGLPRRGGAEIEMRRALDDGELCLFFQPAFDASTGRLEAAEALLRWNHPSRGFLGARHALDAAAEAGLQSAVDEWVVREACREATRWEDIGRADVSLSINLGADRALDERFPSLLRAAFDDSRVRPDRIVLEIPESAFAEGDARRDEVLCEIDRLGVGVVVDRFGRETASLAWMRRRVVRGVKIDTSVVREVDDRATAAVVAAVAAAASRLGFETVAHGVESLREFDALVGLGCGMIQGNLLGRPLPAARMRRVLESASPETCFLPSSRRARL